MSGRHSFLKLSEEIDRDPERRSRVEALKRAYDALQARADAGLSNEELEELAETYGLVSDPKVRESVEEAEAEIDRGEGLSFREVFGEEL